MVHHHSTHAYQYIVLDGTTMNNRSVADRDIISNSCRCPLISAMDDCSVLNVDLIANSDRVDISSYNCLKPDTAIVTHDDIACDRSIF
jgi:hypothetical protein